MRPHFLQLLCQVLRKACRSRLDRQSIQQLLGTVKESNFLRACLPQYVVGMQLEAIPAVRHQYPEHIGNILALVQELVSIFPASSVQGVAMLMAALPASVNALRASGVEFTEEMEKNLEKVQTFIQHLQERRREGTLRVDSCTLMQPPAAPGQDDYRTIPIYPTYDEVHLGETVFLRPNILSQAYESPTAYLDTHFRLLREDFVRPLREGILQLLQSFEDQALRKKRFDSILVYFDVHIVAPLCSPTGIDYKVAFGTKPLKFVRWENSKRLLYGSLVCMSKDHFKTFLFATVSHRQSQELQEGFVHLSFDKNSWALLAEVQPSDTFVMVETTAYFEAYRHVLERLQEIQEEDLPFQKYIVQCEPHLQEPAYLVGGSTYDLRCLMTKAAAGADGQGAPEGLRDPGETLVNILDPQQWPPMEALSLDESQMEALQLALTKELAIIQGPPGTGKTYVGLKIVEALLSNQSAREKSPILVVCYTNHALDQFLEGIYKFQKTGIVRVGGRSSSVTLKKFSLRELRSQGVFRHQLPRHLRWGYNDVTCELRETEEELHECAALLEACLRGVLHERHLKSHMSRQHWDSLLQGWDEVLWMSPEKCSLIQEWLGLGITPFVQGGAVDLNGLGNAGALEEEEEELQNDTDLLAVAEEADLIQAERLLDHDEGGFPRFRQRDTRTAAAELADRLLAVKLADEEEGGPGSSKDAAGWEVQRGQKKKAKQRAKDELRRWQVMAEAEAEAVQNVWRLDLGSRWKLYRYWLQKYQAEVRRRALGHEQRYQAAAERLAELRLQEDRCILETAQVVGMTTTGAARYHHVLQQVAPRVVIVEEAAEVLEAHTITTLSKSCQHLILIGDHQQLRPSANVYDLAKNFSLEVSLFERLVKVGLPFVRLNFQHRMRPEIAQLLTPHIYQHLENHPSVLEYENVKGVSSNLFFVEHNLPEQQLQEGRSHQNQHEAHFVVALCKYFLCQGYLPSQITILTTYTGQLFCLRKLLPAKTFQGVKVHVVDKYQGEENDLILLSLVRSNPEGRVGFLQIANRVCVALSRARKGLFCIGNMAMLSSVQLWSKIIHTLREQGHIGQALLLSCQNHPGTQTEVAQAADFDQVPEGGCSRPCDCRLSCGHVCSRACHPYDPQHKAFQCLKPCQKVLCGDGHRCSRLCYEPCGQCLVPVAKTLPRCGHQQEVPCSTPAEAFCCQEPCGRLLPCGHDCRLACGQECTRRCPEMVQATLKCGHSQSIPCCAAAELEAGRAVACEADCAGTLECGHRCPGSCHSCSNGRFHKQCRSPCKRPLICSHECLQPCTRECPPCPKPCQNRCVHSRCPKTCGEPCTPCVEPCEWRCQHYQCGQLCSEPCDRPRCDEPCPKGLPCGHPCAGVCGELCPKKCLICDRDELTQIFFGFEDEPGARFVQLEDCGHIFETQGLDHYMDQGTDAAVRLKVCPACQTPIRKNLRYSTLVKRSLVDIEVVKKRIRGCPEDIAAGAQRLWARLQEKATLRRHLPRSYRQLQQKLEECALSRGSLLLVEQLLTFCGRLAELMNAVHKLEQAGAKRCLAERLLLNQREQAQRRLGEVGSWLERPRTNFTPQELADLQSEFQRLTYLVDLLAKVKAAQGEMAASAADLVSAAQQVLESPGKFTAEDERLVRAKMEALEAVLPKGGLGISEEERLQIVAAVTGNTRGHWFKCPNGHIYVIGDCGGAMEKSHCPDCQEVIGGTNHHLEPSNQLAPEMDGATHAAWSEATNNLRGAGLRFYD